MSATNSFSAFGAAMLAACALTGLALPAPASAQVVADRTLSDVDVDTVGGCTTLTINFNIRIQVLSHFPEETGRELHVRVRPLDIESAGALRESLRLPVVNSRHLHSAAAQSNESSSQVLHVIEFEAPSPVFHGHR